MEESFDYGAEDDVIVVGEDEARVPIMSRTMSAPNVEREREREKEKSTKSLTDRR